MALYRLYKVKKVLCNFADATVRTNIYCVTLCGFSSLKKVELVSVLKKLGVPHKASASYATLQHCLLGHVRHEIGRVGSWSNSVLQSCLNDDVGLLTHSAYMFLYFCDVYDVSVI